MGPDDGAPLAPFPLNGGEKIARDVCQRLFFTAQELVQLSCLFGNCIPYQTQSIDLRLIHAIHHIKPTIDIDVVPPLL